MSRDSLDFLEILDSLYDQLTDAGAMLFSGCHDATNQAAKRILQGADTRYVPGHKITELMADIINIAASVSCEGWLNDQQARHSFEELTGSKSPIAKTFESEAMMEKARYEPIMLKNRFQTPREERNAILDIRLKRMLQARQHFAPLPSSFLRIIRSAAHRALRAECFSTYRPGPMLQLFDDMIRLADQVADQTFDELEGVCTLQKLLDENSRLWRLYKFKASRFRAAQGDPLIDNHFPITRAGMLFVPDKPGRPTLH